MRRVVIIFSFLCPFIIFGVLHLTPHLALRTHVFFMGYPIEAVKTGIVDDKFHNRTDWKPNAKYYTLTKPPVERVTEGILHNFKVSKNGFLYFAEYFGDV